MLPGAAAIQGSNALAPPTAEDGDMPSAIPPQKEPFMAYLENFIKQRPENNSAPKVAAGPPSP